jgi:hypothetical protein
MESWSGNSSFQDMRNKQRARNVCASIKLQERKGVISQKFNKTVSEAIESLLDSAHDQ